MSNDPKMDGAPIVCKTLCRIGNHAFTFFNDALQINWNVEHSTYTSSGMNGVRCDCGAYSYGEWLDALGLCHYCNKPKHDTPTAICGYRKAEATSGKL